MYTYIYIYTYTYIYIHIYVQVCNFFRAPPDRCHPIIGVLFWYFFHMYTSCTCIVTCCSVLPCAVVCCHVLPCVAVCCSEWCTCLFARAVAALAAVYCSIMYFVAACCSVSQRVAACRSVSQRVAACRSELQHVAMCCEQCVTVCCLLCPGETSCGESVKNTSICQ